nr:TrmH family RNA methyltransferase [Mycoplasmopsis bovis]
MVVGNEEKGISKPIINATDVKVYIPQFGTVQSMNVSVATGILLFELVNNGK